MAFSRYPLTTVNIHIITKQHKFSKVAKDLTCTECLKSITAYESQMSIFKILLLSYAIIK